MYKFPKSCQIQKSIEIQNLNPIQKPFLEAGPAGPEHHANHLSHCRPPPPSPALVGPCANGACAQICFPLGVATSAPCRLPSLSLTCGPCPSAPSSSSRATQAGHATIVSHYLRLSQSLNSPRHQSPSLTLFIPRQPSMA
jgi:hypothetical protein